MAIYKCTVCDILHDENQQELKFQELDDEWLCPVCGSPKSVFQLVAETPAVSANPATYKPVDTSTDMNQETGEKSGTVSDLMISTMINWGVRHVFGMVGHSNLGLADAIRRRCETGDLTFIGIRHEGAASFAASAYAKLVGIPAACLTIAGPGATNLITGLWDAKLDRVPLLALTGQIDLQFLGPGAFQEVDLSAAFKDVSCWSQTVLNGSNYAELMSLAMKNAILKREAAHLIFPNQIQELPAPSGAQPFTPEGRIPPTTIRPPAESLDKAAELIRQSSRPVIILGYGSRSAMSTIIRFAEQFNIPVITTFKAKGLIPDDHPLACGVLGLSGTPISRRFMKDADLLIVLGASFARHTGILKDKPTIQVDFDPMVLGKFHPVTVPVWGDIGVTVEMFMTELISATPKADRRREVAQQWAQWRQEKAKRENKRSEKGLSSALVFSSMNLRTPHDAVIALDVGNNTYSFGRYFECKSQSILMSGYLGSIGYGYPAALGASVAAPERPIFAVTGDGGFAQYMGELNTAIKYRLPIKHILLNNQELGKISLEQRLEGRMVWSTSLQNPDFSKYAENCGALGIRVSTPEALDEALERIVDHDGPALLEVMTDPELT